MIPLDKLLHASLSANVTFGVTALCLKLGLEPAQAAAIGVGFSLALGAAKELVWDLALGRGTPDPWDMAANASGTTAGIIAYGLTLRF